MHCRGIRFKGECFSCTRTSKVMQEARNHLLRMYAEISHFHSFVDSLQDILKSCTCEENVPEPLTTSSRDVDNSCSKGGVQSFQPSAVIAELNGEGPPLSPILANVHRKNEEAAYVDFQCAQTWDEDPEETAWESEESVTDKDIVEPLTAQVVTSPQLQAANAYFVPPLSSNVATDVVTDVVTAVSPGMEVGKDVVGTHGNVLKKHTDKTTTPLESFAGALTADFGASLSPILRNVHGQDEEAATVDLQCAQTWDWDADETARESGEKVLDKNLVPPPKAHVVTSTQLQAANAYFEPPISSNVEVGKDVGTHGNVLKKHTGKRTPPLDTFAGKGMNLPGRSMRSHLKDKNSSFDKLPNWREHSQTPYRYLNDPVRKRSERMKLRGTTCTECSQSHPAILGMSKSDKKYQEIINKVSKHRYKHGRRCKTPEGYWNPEWHDPATH